MFHSTTMKGKPMKKALFLLSTLLFSIGLSACNTMQGLGKDVEAGGEKLEGSAARQQDQMQQNR